MAFALSDFKKTSRKVGEDRRLYPYVIRDDRHLSAIAFAIDYFERMVGRRRAEIDPATLLEFFGEPRLARGLVACLSRTYVWRNRSIREVVDSQTYSALEARGLVSPVALRAYLYQFVNGHYDGFLLPEQRHSALALLCRDLPLTPQKLDELLVLDSEEEAVLTRVGTIPDANDIVALYNFHSLETALRHSSKLTLHLNGPVWAIVRSVHNLSRRYNLLYEIAEAPHDLFGTELSVIWHGRRDVLGNWSRHGRRLVRALLRLLAAHPDCPIEGTARVHLQRRSYQLALDRRALSILGVEARRLGQGDEAWEPQHDSQLMQEWSRAAARGKTQGWRLRRDPEPIVTEQMVLVPDFIAVRGQQRVPLFVPASIASAQSLVGSLAKPPARSLLVVPAEAVRALKRPATPLVPYVDVPGVADLVAALETHFPAPDPQTALTRWQQLEVLLHQQGFVAEERLVAMLGCNDVAEIAAALRGWADGARAYYVPGLGLCTPERLGVVRKLLDDAA